MASSTSSSERSLSVLLLAAVLVLGAAWLNNTWPDQKYIDIHRPTIFWKNKVYGIKDGSMNIVLSGDSRVYRGLSPDAFQSVLPDARAFNFGFSSGGHNGLIFKEIDRILAADTTQLRAVVLGLTPYSLTPKAQANGEFIDYKSRGPVSVWEPFNEFFRPMTYGRLKKVIKRIPPKPRTVDYTYLDNGWVRSDWLKRDPASELHNYQTNFDGNKVDARTIEGVMQKTAEWASRGIIVIGYRPPTTKAMVALENRLSGYDETAIKKAFKAAGGIWVDTKGDFETFDGSHLTPESSEKLSKILATAIAEATSTH